MSETNPPAADSGFDFKLYRYMPSLAAGIVATIIFLALTVLHTWRLVRARAFYFIAFTIGGAFQTIGYAARIASSSSPESLPPFIIQAILILIAPALYAASIYMILARLIVALRADHLSLIPPRWLTRLFVTGDVVAFSLQAGGGGIQSAGSLEMFELGEKVIVAGLFAQIVVFSFFVVVSALFHVRVSRAPTERATGKGLVVIPWRRDLYVLYVTSGIILVRSVFRVVEYLQGNGGYLISREVFLYVFDAILMAGVMAVFLVWYVDHLEGKGKGKSHERLVSEEEGLRELGPRG